MKSAELLKLEDLIRGTFRLNKYESEILAFLLFNGECEINKISGDVPRSRRYDVVESLEKEGFIEIKKKKNSPQTNKHSKLHKDYIKPEKTKYIAFNLQKIIDNQKKQRQFQLNEEIKVMNEFKSLLEKQIKVLKLET